jgi:predicted PurR-regulated permease PerM
MTPPAIRYSAEGNPVPFVSGDKPPRGEVEAKPIADNGAEPGPAPLVIQMPVDIRHVALSLGAAVAVIWLLKNAQDVLIPFVVSGVLFYALDPFVDRLQRWRVPRAIGALVMLLAVVGAIGTTGYYLSDQFVSVVEQVPTSVRKLRDELRKPAVDTGALSKMQQAADAIDRTAAENTQPAPAPRGVVRVQVEQPGFRVADYVSSGWQTLPAIAGVTVMIFFLTLFLLIADDLFKRKLVKHVGAFSRKRVTVQILDEIGQQMERFILVQIFTSAIVAVATFGALWWLGLEHAAVWGLVAGLLNSIPYFGPVVVSIAIAIVGYMQFGQLSPTLSVAGAALAVTTLEGWVLTPLLLGRMAQMNPIATFAALLFWTWLWGAWGMLLAVPITMAIKVVCDHIEPFRPIGDFLGE